MAIRDLDRRIARIEAQHQVGAPTAIASGRPLEDGEAEEAIANWQTWVSDGRASLMGKCLYVRPPVLTVDEWIAFTAHHHGQAFH